MYGLDTNFVYMCTVTLTLEIRFRVKVMTHPYIMDNNFWLFIQIQLCSERVLPGQGFGVYVHFELE